MDESTVPVCEVVPEGVNTTGNSGMTLETLNLVSGFYRTSYQSREVLECYREEACLGGSNAGSYCAEGYTGSLRGIFDGQTPRCMPVPVAHNTLNSSPCALSVARARLH